MSTLSRIKLLALASQRSDPQDQSRSAAGQKAFGSFIRCFDTQQRQPFPLSLQVARLQAAGDAALAQRQAEAEQWEAAVAAERSRLAEQAQQLQVRPRQKPIIWRQINLRR